MSVTGSAHDGRMQLPDWVDQPVPEYPLTPKDDAIGKFVLACKGLEVWIAIQYVHFVDGMTYAAAMKVDISTQVDFLARHSELVPLTDRARYVDAMETAKQIIEFRNGVIHGIGWPNDENTAWLSERPDRRAKQPIEEKTPWVNVVYSRELLIGAALKAKWIGGFLQSESSEWPTVNQLLVDPGPPAGVRDHG